jgi:hypothetical protein
MGVRCFVDSILSKKRHFASTILIKNELIIMKNSIKLALFLYRNYFSSTLHCYYISQAVKLITNGLFINETRFPKKVAYN